MKKRYIEYYNGNDDTITTELSDHIGFVSVGCKSYIACIDQDKYAPVCVNYTRGFWGNCIGDTAVDALKRVFLPKIVYVFDTPKELADWIMSKEDLPEEGK
jgi:hypothetical protein